jgi:hypothetical protein
MILCGASDSEEVGWGVIYATSIGHTSTKGTVEPTHASFIWLQGLYRIDWNRKEDSKSRDNYDDEARNCISSHAYLLSRWESSVYSSWLRNRGTGGDKRG